MKINVDTSGQPDDTQENAESGSNSVVPESEQAALSTTAKTLSNAVKIADHMLKRCTGLGSADRRTVAYYCVATHFMKSFNPFPLLVINGPSGTGKTTTLRICLKLCKKPKYLIAEGITDPVLRDALGDTHNGTAIIDEADEPKADLESYLRNRYLKETAVAGKKVREGDDWKTLEIETFGATIVHRRIPFKDFALESRSIMVKTTYSGNRQYDNPDDLGVFAQAFHKKISAATSLTPPNHPAGVKSGGRVIDAFLPLLSIGQLVDDHNFIHQLLEKIDLAVHELTEGQTYEVNPLLLQAVIAQSEEEDGLSFSKGIKVEGVIIEWIRDYHKRIVSPRQAAKILREYGLEVRKVGGVNRVIVSDIKSFVKTCMAAGLAEDELVETEAKKLGLV